MKCPKCGYISFDFNQVCPKCSKDIGSEQDKLNLPSFRPETPAFLGALLGEADDSGAVQMGTGTEIDTGEHGVEVDFEDSGATDSGELSFEDAEAMDSGELAFEDSGAMDSGELALEDSGDLDISLESEGVGEVEPAEEPISAFDSGELMPSAGETEIASEESVTDFDLEGDPELRSMGTGEMSSMEPEAELTTPEPGPEEGELEIDLDDLSLEDSGVAEALEKGELPAESEATPNDVDSLALDLEETPQEAETPVEPVEEEEVALDLDDLKIDESGELKVDTGAEAPGEVSLEEAPAEVEAQEEMESESEELALDLDALSADVEETSKAPGGGDDLSLDLDDLELELDLEDKEEEPS